METRNNYNQDWKLQNRQINENHVECWYYNKLGHRQERCKSRIRDIKPCQDWKGKFCCPKEMYLKNQNINMVHKNNQNLNSTPTRTGGVTNNSICSLILQFCTLSIATINKIPSTVLSICSTRIRPRVDVTINGKNTSWLYDTGATRTCLNERVFRQLFRPDQRKKAPTQSYELLTDASGITVGV